ncbi:glucosamine-6-phosphate isomerase 1 [Rhizopus delemar RA 99-880]|uniref:Glucosamine-6-phosphate isomerase 1 n=1 Tax=Rhizopus delemar (strain RA 99-880 / ATCC MYA-4621 / FGSC 9543 / NRRL 43880) TaxID=246409 RepID=I1BW88_RHIO9|nr:glucosamine-6-phosphate isomerase 1 [Rhizopus delemar RA 99-880]|eukprot:EIE80468.1 glucosamine-6-phosphate isomerase 1 [Rhizopus delemar RA 99-880]
MRLIIRNDYDAVSEWVVYEAHYIKERINQFEPTKSRPFVLGLPTGSSPLNTYKRLAEFCKEGKLSFKYVVTFNMDEYLFIGGIGPDGHIAFNEPGSSLTSRTRVKTLAYETIIANARFFEGDITKVPKLALTVGVATVMDAREVCIIITGAHRSIALAKCVEEGVNHMWTVSAIQMHPKGLIVCDEDATLELHVKTVKYFKSIEHVHQSLIGQENLGLQGELLSPKKVQRSVRLSRDVMVRKLLNGELSDEEEEDEDQELELPKQLYPSNSKKRRLDINA